MKNSIFVLAGDPFSIFEQQEHYCRQKDAPYSQPQKLSYYNEAIRYNPDVSRLHFFSQPTQINNLLLAIPLQTSQQAAVTPEVSQKLKLCVCVWRHLKKVMKTWNLLKSDGYKTNTIWKSNFLHIFAILRRSTEIRV